MSDARWSLLEAARGPLLAEFAPDGVVRIDFVAAFPHADGFAVWLCTATDTQRDLLKSASSVQSRVQRVLLATGFGQEQLSDLVTVQQSQQTVDRDYQGSWFYATR